ncbi:hypothetical protein BD626DRAFT_506006 [Schizophyllum amplum]|uniref:Uncharacterized protein n=1 Tax=Schizophyllum amplum TaxID=97359 RepID=A0A550C673_9AGAR|nr:hypothetical protein BD626DRAFT_506006 [Auriculariopsis ampla]
MGGAIQIIVLSIRCMAELCDNTFGRLCRRLGKLSLDGAHCADPHGFISFDPLASVRLMSGFVRAKVTSQHAVSTHEAGRL